MLTRTVRLQGSMPADVADVRQQRRLKQTVRFLHRDSADLLPLDGLKKLGTSNQGQPHHILQKRFFEAKLRQGSVNICGLPPNNDSLNFTHLSSHDDEDEEEEDDDIRVPCQCLGRELTLLIDTGCKQNLMSLKTVDRLGLKDFVEQSWLQASEASQRTINVVGSIESLSLTLGRVRILCCFAVVDVDEELVSLGSKTLRTLKSVVDTENQLLVFGRTAREQVHFSSRVIRNC